MSKNKKSVFTGAATALVTPFRDGRVDYFALKQLIDRQIANGIDALVIAGTTGEASTLSDAEHRELLSRAIELIGGRVPAIAGIGSNDTAHAVETTRFAANLGYGAVLAVTPYYNKATDAGLIKSFTAIADASTCPVILYNVPTRTSCNISLPVYRTLARHENIVAVKEASGNVSAVADLICHCGDDLDVYSGNDDQTLPLLSLGGAGVISVVSNVIPRQVSELCALWRQGDVAGARRVHEKYLLLMRAMFCEVNPIPVKTALCLMGQCLGELRLPLCEPEQKSLELIKKALEDHALI